jgi:hypothetical protein
MDKNVLLTAELIFVANFQAKPYFRELALSKGALPVFSVAEWFEVGNEE